MAAHPFELICEIEPPTTPDLDHVRRQIETLGPVATAFLVPDNHIGRATVSSVAVAHEVEVMGGRSIACLNARDRNLLGFQRDLLTAAAYGVDQFLFVYGDKPATGGRTGELTVRTMLDEAGRSPHDRDWPRRPFRVGAAAGLGPLPGSKGQADFLFVQVGFSLEPLLRWREQVDLDMPVYAGVMTLASVTMAANLAASIPDIDIPATLDRLSRTGPRCGGGGGVRAGSPGPRQPGLRGGPPGPRLEVPGGRGPAGGRVLTRVANGLGDVLLHHGEEPRSHSPMRRDSCSPGSRPRQASRCRRSSALLLPQPTDWDGAPTKTWRRCVEVAAHGRTVSSTGSPTWKRCAQATGYSALPR